MNVIKKIDSFLLKTQNAICIATGLVMVVLIVAAAFLRFVFKINFSGSEEIIMFTAFWFYFMGSSAASREDSQITADMSNLMVKNPKVLQIIRLIKYFVSTVISCVGTVWAYQFLVWYAERNPRSPIYRLPEIIMVIPVFISFVLMTVYLFGYFLNAVRRTKEVFAK